MGNEQGKVLDTTTPEGVQTMDENLQRKFSKGIQYNMKVVVRGDRNTGKSCLLYRMQGKSFTESYIPTNEIQVGHILWTYPGTSDTVKVEIWDIVDKGKSQKSSRGLKLFNKEEDGAGEPVLDAEFLDVYKGAHAVILMYDIVKQWTWQYIERQIVQVPYHIPILVLGNFSDMGVHRNIPYEDADFYVTHLNRPEGAADVRYAECSMKNGFGLRFLHKFLSIPFLQMQQEALLHQLKTNREQILVIQEELDGYQSSNSYEQFQNSLATPQKPEQAVAEATPSTPPTKPKPKPSPVVDTSKAFDSTDESIPESEVHVSTGRKLSSKLSGFLSKTKEPTNVQQKGKHQPTPKSLTPKSPAGRKGVKNVDEFVPDGDLDDQFFNDDDSARGEEEIDGEDTDSDSDYNPQVAMDQDLSSVEGEEEEGEGPEEGVAAGVATLTLTQQQDDDNEEDENYVDDDSPLEEVDGDHKFIERENPDILIPSVVKATPVSPPKPKKKTEIKPLKSVYDIVLTESEEDKSDDEPIARQDVIVPKPSKEKSSRKESGGLLLAFNETQPVKQKPKKKKSEVELSESPSTERKKERRSSDSKHKKHKKKSSRREKEQETVEEKPKANEDPFGFNTSLDAWLGAGDESPAQPRSTHGLSRRLTESIEEEEEEKPTKKRDGKKRRKSKKDSGVLNELI